MEGNWSCRAANEVLRIGEQELGYGDSEEKAAGDQSRPKKYSLSEYGEPLSRPSVVPCVVLPST